MEEMLHEIRNIAVEAANIIATPNWAAKWSLVVSGLAILISGLVAWRQNRIAKTQTEIARKQADISKEQNKITLFKERYPVYCEFQKVINVCGHISDDDARDYKGRLLHAIMVIYGLDYQLEKAYNIGEIAPKLLIQFKVSEYKIRQAVFLFSGIEESDIDDLLIAWLALISIFFNQDHEEEIAVIEKFVKECHYFEEKYIGMMEDQLNLK